DHHRHQPLLPDPTCIAHYQLITASQDSMADNATDPQHYIRLCEDYRPQLRSEVLDLIQERSDEWRLLKEVEEVRVYVKNGAPRSSIDYVRTRYGYLF